MMKLLLCMIFMAVAHATLGVGLWRTYTTFVKLPQSAQEAKSQGWISSGRCEFNLGVRWQQQSSISKDKPVFLYFTPYGQLTGVGVRAFGNLTGNVVSKGWWRRVGSGEYEITATFRQPFDVCSNSALRDALGDRVVINAANIAYSVPMSKATAESSHFETGSCFASMGTHSFSDLTSNSMTWKANNLMPVVPMYDRNRNFNLNAIFFTTPVNQQKLSSATQWEPIVLPNAYMCGNWCNPQCGWNDATEWSTIHFYFNSPSTVSCLNDCQQICCEQ